MQSRKEDAFAAFGQFCLCATAAAVITSLWMHSVVPLAIVAVGVFITMSFMNGLNFSVQTA